MSVPLRRLLGLAAVAVAGLFGSPPAARAADNTWTNGAGTFAWNTTDANWTAPAVWNNQVGAADGAVFGAAGVGTVNVATGINARSLDFGTTTGYTLAGGSITFSPFGTSSQGAGVVNIGASGITNLALGAQTATFSSGLVSRFGLTKTGAAELILSGPVDVTGAVQLGDSPYGANLLVGSATSQSFGGALRLAAGASLPATTSVALGSGLFDIGATSRTLASVTFANTNSANRTPTNQGVVGTGTLTTNLIRVVGNGELAFGNTFAAPLSGGGGTVRLEVGSGFNAANEIVFSQPVSNGSFLKTYGVSSVGGFSTSGFTFVANNTYTGATTVAGSVSNVVAGTNASTALNVVNGTTALQGASGSFAAATAVRLGPNGALVLSDTAAIAVGAAPAVTAGVLADRLGTAAALSLDGGTFQQTSGTVANVQTLASVAALTGFNRINLVAGAGGAAVVNVTGGLSLGAGSTLVVGGASVGTTATAAPTATRVLFSGGLPATVNGLIPGLYTASSSGGSPATFARNSAVAGVGVVGLAAADYTTLAAATPTSNADVTANATVAASTSANAVRSAGLVTITINAGQTLALGAGGYLNTGAATIAGPGTLAFGNTVGLLTSGISGLTVTAPITGTAGLAKHGTGTTTLSGDLSGLGGTLVNAGVGTLALNTGGFAGPITLLAGTLSSTSSGVGAGGLLTLGSPATPGGTAGPATVANFNVTGLTTVARNIATAGGDGTTPFTQAAVGNSLTVPNAAQGFTGTVALASPLAVNMAGPSAVTTFSGVVSGAGGLEQAGGAGTLVLSNPGNTFTGGTRVNAGGTLVAAAAGALGTGPVRLNGGTVRTDAAGPLNGAGGLTLVSSGTINTNGNAVSLAGGINGENPVATLTKAGAGVLTVTGTGTLPGAITFSGATPNGGITLAGVAGALPNVGTVTVPAGATFTLDNSTSLHTDRLRDTATVVMGGGLFSYLGGTTAISDPAERLGLLTTSASGGVLSVTAGTASPTVLRFAALAANNVLTLRGDGLGAASGNVARIFIDAITGNQSVLPNVFFASTAGTATSTTAAGYDLSRGVIQFVPTQVGGVSINNFAPDNVPTLAAFTTTGNATAATGASVFSLTLDGGSTLTLNGGNAASGTNANTPDGTLAVSGGQLVSQNGAKSIVVGTAATPVVSLGSAPGLVTTTSDLTIAAGITLSGTGGLTKLGTGTLAVNGPYAVLGQLTVGAGTLATTGPLSVGNLSVAAGATLNTNGGGLAVTDLAGGGAVATGAGNLTAAITGTSTFAGSLASTGTFTKAGAGTLTLTGGTPFAYGAAAVTAGNLVLGAPNVLSPTGPLTLGPTTGGNGYNFNLNGFNQTVGGLTFVAPNALTTALTVPAGSTLAVAGDISYVNNTSAVDNSSPVQVTGGGTIDLGGATRAVTVQSNNNGVGDLQVSAVLANGGISFTGNPTAGGTVARLAINAPATYSGPTVVNRGELRSAVANALSPNSVLTLAAVTGNTATLNLNSVNQTIGGLASTSGGANTVVLGSGVLTVSQTVGTLSNAVISGTGGLTKAGPGTLVLTGANTYTGATTVNGGVLRGTATLPSAVTVNAGGLVGGGDYFPGGPNVAPAGTLTTSAAVTVTAGGGLSAVVGASAASLLSLTGAATQLNLSPGAGNTFVVNLVENPASPLVIGQSYTYNLAQVAAAGNIFLNGSALPDGAISLSNYTFTGVTLASSSLSVSGSFLTVTFVPVPEPATVLAVAAAGLGGLRLVRRRRATA